MILRYKKNHEIKFSAPNIKYVNAGIMKWYKVEYNLDGVPRAFSATFWEPEPQEK